MCYMVYIHYHREILNILYNICFHEIDNISDNTLEMIKIVVI